MNKIVPYLPIWAREPNKFIRYDLVPFDFGNGYVGKYRIAVFSDKSGKIREEVAHVLWECDR